MSFGKWVEPREPRWQLEQQRQELPLYESQQQHARQQQQQPRAPPRPLSLEPKKASGYLPWKKVVNRKSSWMASSFETALCIVYAKLTRSSIGSRVRSVFAKILLLFPFYDSCWQPLFMSTCSGIHDGCLIIWFPTQKPLLSLINVKKFGKWQKSSIFVNNFKPLLSPRPKWNKRRP